MMLSTWISDVRYAARRLRTRPGYALLAVLTLAPTGRPRPDRTQFRR
jgi:hypothetical protein